MKKVFRKCHLHYTWISDVSEGIYIWKLEKHKQISPNLFFKYNPNMPGFARSGWQNYQEQMCSLQVPRIWNHQPLLNMYEANLLNIHYWQPRKTISLDNNSLEIQAKSCDFTLNPDQQSHVSQMHPTEQQCCQYLALAAVAKSKHSLLQLRRQNSTRLCWSRNLPDPCSMTLFANWQPLHTLFRFI